MLADCAHSMANCGDPANPWKPDAGFAISQCGGAGTMHSISRIMLRTSSAPAVFMPARVLSICASMATKYLEFTGRSRSGGRWLSTSRVACPVCLPQQLFPDSGNFAIHNHRSSGPAPGPDLVSPRHLHPSRWCQPPPLERGFEVRRGWTRLHPGSRQQMVCPA